MILPQQDFAPCGYVLKPHGRQGAVKCQFRLFFQPDFEAHDWCFLSLNNKPVPFYIEAISYSDDGCPVMKLAGIDSPEHAKQYKQSLILYPKASLEIHDQGHQPLIGLEGLAVYDQSHQWQGHITNTTELSDQLIITISPGRGAEAFEAPCHPDLVIAIDRQQAWLQLYLPAGIDNL